MRLCVLDGHTLNPGDNPWRGLEELGELTIYPRSAEHEVLARAKGAEIVLTNKTPLRASTLASLPELRFISVLATGYNVVDLEAARQHTIVVSNVPEYGTASVAQHVFALLLELTQRTGEHARAVEAGDWGRCPDFSFWRHAPIELEGLRLGIVGFGRIGRRVASIGRALGMTVITSSQAPDVSESGAHAVDLETLFRESDVVTLHCPLSDRNPHLINATSLAAMKRSAFLINTARGGLVDETALAGALRSGSIAGAGLDVVGTEPMADDNPLRQAPNCIVTPHLAWASLAARQRLMAQTVVNVRAFMAGKPVNIVS